MSKYKVGDKVVFEIIKGETYGDYLAGSKEQNWWFNAEGLERGSEPIGTYTEPLEAKIRRQAAEITRLLRENKELKNEKQELTRERNQLMGRCGGLSAAQIKEFNNGRLVGQNEAWEFTRNIALSETYGGYSNNKLKEIFGSIYLEKIFNLTYSEAAAKVAEWERQKKEIKVGDVLEDIADNNVKCVVTKPHSSNMAYLIFSDGSAGLNELDNLRKTGRHTDMGSFLKQIGGEE